MLHDGRFIAYFNQRAINCDTTLDEVWIRICRGSISFALQLYNRLLAKYYSTRTIVFRYNGLNVGTGKIVFRGNTVIG